MARKPAKPKSSTGSATGRRRRKARAVTIDLEATEVGSEETNGDAPSMDTSSADDLANAENDTPESETVSEARSAQNEDVAPDAEAGAGNSGIPVSTYFKYGASGLAGGLLALLIHSGLTATGILPGGASGDVANLTTRVEQLRENVANQQDQRNALIGQIETRLDGLAANDGASELATKLAALETQLSEAAAGSEGLASQVLEIRQSADAGLAALSERFDGLVSTDTGPQIVGLEARLASLEANTKTLLVELQAAATSGGETGVSGADLLALRQSVASLQASTEEIRATLTARLDGLNQLFDAAKAVSASLDSRITETSTVLSTQMDTIESRVQALANNSETLVDFGAESRAAVNLAFAALERLFVAGLPYETEISILTNAETIPADLLARLSATASSGASTISDLAEQFEQRATQIIEADRSQTEGGFLDSALSQIRSVVRIRPTGFVDGDSVAAIVARVEAHLGDGQLKAALDELVALEGSAAEAAADWFVAAKARLEAADALAAINTELLKLAQRSGAGTGAGVDAGEGQ